MQDAAPIHKACHALLDAAATVADADTVRTPLAGEWNADQIVAHVSLVNAATIAAAYAIASGANTTYDNRLALDTWTINHTIELAGGSAGLRTRIRQQADVLGALGSGLSDAELDSLVPTLLLSHDAVMADQPIPLRGLLDGLADAELPGHTQQLLALLPEPVEQAVC